MQTLAKPFGWLLLKLYELTGSYGAALILFALAIRVILLPFTIKSKLGMMRTTRLAPQLKELEKRHGANSKKYADEMRKLYKEEGVSPSSSCLWTFIQLPILLALYQAIRYPLTVMMGIPSAMLEAGGAIYEKLQAMNFTTTISSAYEQIAQTQFISDNFAAFSGISDKLVQMDFSFIGLNLGKVPELTFWKFFSEPELWPAVGLFAIPFLAGFLQMLQTKIGESTNGYQNERQQESMQSTMAMMPIITIMFCFGMPAGVGLYWAAGSFFMIIQDALLAKYYKTVSDKENAEFIEREKRRNAELEAKRAETERRREEGTTVQNRSTSKKKRQQQERLAQEAKAAEYENEKRGNVKNPSQVGDRPNARGRAYDPDRYNK